MCCLLSCVWRWIVGILVLILITLCVVILVLHFQKGWQIERSPKIFEVNWTMCCILTCLCRWIIGIVVVAAIIVCIVILVVYLRAGRWNQKWRVEIKRKLIIAKKNAAWSSISGMNIYLFIIHTFFWIYLRTIGMVFWKVLIA